jgi:hypothetical protein
LVSTAVVSSLTGASSCILASLFLLSSLLPRFGAGLAEVSVLISWAIIVIEISAD